MGLPAADYGPGFPSWGLYTRSSAANSKHSVSQGTTGFRSGCGEAVEAAVQCLPGVAQPTKSSLTGKEGKGLGFYLGKMLPFSTKRVGLRRAVCHDLVFFAVSLWRRLGVLGKRGCDALLAEEEPTSCWATGRICNMVTFVTS